MTSTFFHDLPAAAFPFTVEFIRVSDGKVVLEINVTGPGAVPIPGLSEEHGPVRARITYADGRVCE